MHIILLVRTYPHEIRNGFDAYAGSLIKEYERTGMDFEVRTAKNERFVDNPKLSPLFYDLLYPLMGVFKRPKDAVFHAISESQAIAFPFLAGRKVVTIHHINPLRIRLRELYRPSTAYALFWQYCTDVAVSYADAIICISEQTKNELIELYKLDEDKITVIPQAVADKFEERPSLRNKRMIGYIGPFTARKNIPALFEAFRSIHADPELKDVRLKICGSGPSGPVQEGISADPELAKNIVFKGEVAAKEIVAEYNELAALLYPSLHEGFGLGILEAQMCGVPVFVLKDAQIPEDVARYAIKCIDAKDIAYQVGEYLKGRLPYDAQKAKSYASSFSEEARAKRTIELYQKVGSG